MEPSLSLLFAFAVASSLHAQLRNDLRIIAVQAHGRVGVACALPGILLDCDVNATAQLPMRL
jgi:hypothetical protein